MSEISEALAELDEAAARIEALWDEQDDEEKAELVTVTAIMFVTGEADLLLSVKVFELAHRDGIDAPTVITSFADLRQELVDAS